MKKLLAAAAAVIMTAGMLTGCAKYSKEGSNTEKFVNDINAAAANESYYITVNKDITSGSSHQVAVFSCYYDGERFCEIKQTKNDNAPEKDFYTATIAEDGKSTEVNLTARTAKAGYDVPNIPAYAGEKTAELYNTAQKIYEKGELVSVKEEDGETAESFKSGSDKATFFFDGNGELIRLEIPSEDIKVILTFEYGTEYDDSVFDVPDDCVILGE